MSQKQEPIELKLTSPAVLLFGNLFEPRIVGNKNQTKGTPKYDITLGLSPDHADITAIKALALKAAKEKWPGRDIAGQWKEGIFKFPFTDGNKLAAKAEQKGKDGDLYRGKIVLVARSQYEPNLAAVVNGKLVDFNDQNRATAKPYFYRGAEVFALLNFQAYDGGGDNPDGVTAYLQQVVSLNKGDRLGKQVSAAETFKDYIGSVSGTDPTGGEDEIAF